MSEAAAKTLPVDSLSFHLFVYLIAYAPPCLPPGRGHDPD